MNHRMANGIKTMPDVIRAAPRYTMPTIIKDLGLTPLLT
jgi:hypothetical protein